MARNLRQMGMLGLPNPRSGSSNLVFAPCCGRNADPVSNAPGAAMFRRGIEARLTDGRAPSMLPCASARAHRPKNWRPQLGSYLRSRLSGCGKRPCRTLRRRANGSRLYAVLCPPSGAPVPNRCQNRRQCARPREHRHLRRSRIRRWHHPSTDYGHFVTKATAAHLKVLRTSERWRIFQDNIRPINFQHCSAMSVGVQIAWTLRTTACSGAGV